MFKSIVQITLVLGLVLGCRAPVSPDVSDSPKKTLAAASSGDDVVITTKNTSSGKLIVKAGESVNWTFTASGSALADPNKKFNLIVENKPETFTVSSNLPSLTLTGNIPASFQGGATVAIILREMNACGKAAGANCASPLRNTAYDKVFSYPLEIAAVGNAGGSGLENIPLNTNNNGGLSIQNTPIVCTKGQGNSKIILGGLMTFFNPLAGIPMIVSGIAQNKVNASTSQC